MQLTPVFIFVINVLIDTEVLGKQL
jgi:hypothetical protein